MQLDLLATSDRFTNAPPPRPSLDFYFFQGKLPFVDILEFKKIKNHVLIFYLVLLTYRKIV